MKSFDIITIFPNAFSYLNESILWRAQDRKLIKINIHNLRDFSKDKRRRVDDTPYGGGAGMVLKIEPIAEAINSILKSKIKKATPPLLPLAKAYQKSKLKSRIILLSAKGKTFDQKTAKRLLKYDRIIFICGRYEGVDERVAKYVADEEISIGNYVLSGGELPAMVVTDAVARLIPGVIKKESLAEESFSIGKSAKTLEYPQYTKPETVKIDGKIRKAPKVLLSGNHAKIKEWREKFSERIDISE